MPSRHSSPRARSHCPTARRARSPWSARARRATATTPPTSRSSWPSRPARNPRAFAELVAAQLTASAGIADVEVAGPGFLNITVEAGAQGQVAADDRRRRGVVRSSRRRWPASRSTSSSSRPTRPGRSTSGHTRWAAVGDAIARVFRPPGAEVTREFYFNDRGAQIDRFGASLDGRGHGTAGAGGRLRRRLHRGHRQATSWPAARGRSTCPTGSAQEAFRESGVRAAARGASSSRSHDFGIALRRLLPRGRPARERGGRSEAIDAAHATLGTLYEADGALWLRTDRRSATTRTASSIRSNGSS